MSRLDYSCETNLESKDWELQSPYLEYFIFQLKDGNYLYVSSQGEDEYLLEDHSLSGVIQDLEFRVFDGNLNAIGEWELVDEAPERFKELISSAELVAFKAGDDDLLEAHGYESDFVPTAENVNVQITVKDETIHYAVAKKLLDEHELEDKLMLTWGRMEKNKVTKADIAAYLMSKLSYSDFIGDNISVEASECTARVYFSCIDKDIAKKVFGWNCDDHAIGIVLGLIVNPLTDKEPRLCEDDDVRIAPVFESRIPFPAPWGTEWKTSDPKVFLTYGDWMPQNILSPDDIQRLRDIGVEHCKASIEEIRQRFISWKMEQGWHFGIGR